MITYILLKLAAGPFTIGTGSGDDTKADIPKVDAGDLLVNGLNIAYFIAGTVAVITIIVAGIMYATSAGEASNVTKAKNLILYAIVGLVIVLSAFAITNFVSGRF